MKWSEARDRALATWEEMAASVETMDPVELLREVNAMSELCDTASEHAHGEARCPYCIAYEKYGDCRDVTARLTLGIANKEWDQVHRIMDEYADRLRSLKEPEEKA